MKKMSLIVAAGVLAGCAYLPELELRLTDRAGRPLPAVEVSVAASDDVELTALAAPPEGPKPVGARGTLFTDEEGTVRLGWTPPEGPGFFAWLFGAPTPPPGWVSLTYCTPDGVTMTQRMSVPAH